MSDRPYHHGALEAALTDEAMRVVKVAGIGSLALRELARSIGVSPSATYRHFPSRDHLVSRVAQLARQELAEAMLTAHAAAPATGDRKRRAIVRLRTIGRAYVMFAVEQPKMFEAAFTRCSVPPTIDDDPSAWQVLVDAIDHMEAVGAITAARRKDAPMIAWAGVHGIATILTASIWPAGLSADQEIDAVLDGVARALR